MRRLAGALLVLIAVAPACSRDGGDDGRYTLKLDGKAEIVRGTAERTVDGGDHRLDIGETVRMLAGEAVLELPGDRSLLLRAGRAGRDATVLDVAAVPEIVAGDAVAVAGDALHFSVGDVDVQLQDGAARVQRALSVTVALYEGAAEVSSAGRAFDGGVPALRQVTVPATGLLPREATPLLYDDAAPDPWDRRFLGDAIDLGTDLDSLARGFTGQVGPRVSVDASLLARVLPTLAEESSFGDALLDDVDRSAGEALIGAAIVVESSASSFQQRWDDVFAFRADGARWGLVALDQQVKRDALLGSIDDAFRRSPLLFATQRSSSGGVAFGPTTTTPPGGNETTTTPPPTDGEDPTTTTTAPPVTVPPLTVPPLLDDPGPDEAPDSNDGGSYTTTDLVDVVGDIVGGLLEEPEA